MYLIVKKLFNTAIIIVAIFLISATVIASQLTHQFKSPAFTGQGYSNHVLSIEQLEHNRSKDIADSRRAEAARIERELENSTLNKFVKNLESRIYATLSKQMVDNMFAGCEDGDESCSNPQGGTTSVEGLEITWRRDISGGITLTVDGPDGFTEITIPGSGEFNF